MDAEAEAVEFPGWELLQNHNHNHNHNDQLQLDSESLPLPLIRHDHFSLHPIPNSSSNSSSSTDPSEVDRNFDDSYVATQLFQSNLWKTPSDSDQLSEVADVAESESESESDAEPNRQEEEEKKARVVWWKLPFEVFKYWVVRVAPVPLWSLSVAAAAAFLGLAILGRRLYKMKRNTPTFKLNVALDDKKASQLMGRVARLNEAFSVVRRVPIVRPSLPASTVTLRPVMSLR